MGSLFRNVAARLAFSVHSSSSLRCLELASACPHSPLGAGTQSRLGTRHFSPARPLHKTKPGKAPEPAREERSAGRKEERRPWHRKGSDAEKPARSPDPAGGDASKGRLLTTPTRLLKLILPIPVDPKSSTVKEKADSSDELVPLALLVHPQQPLSYLESLIQAELPPVRLDDGSTKLPKIHFRAEGDKKDGTRDQASGGAREAGHPQDQNVASYSGLGHEGPSSEAETNWVRWSSSTEVGDFIRDAARGREFAVVVEGVGREVRVAVPSFKDRTYYMSRRLRTMSAQIDDMAQLKEECDGLAHRGAHRIAKAGFGVVGAWWLAVYYCSFHTELTWDTMEPITYLAGLIVIMAGYWYFLYVSRDVSYKAALNATVSRRQHALYESRGVDIQRWEQLVYEANLLRREIRMVADEYAVDWDEKRDLGSDEVREVLEKEKRHNGMKEDEEAEEKEKEKE